MHHRLTWTALVLLAVGLLAHADPPAGYYATAEGKRGAELRGALHAIIRNHHVIPYSSSSTNDTSDALKDLDEDPANTNNVLCIYSGKSEAKSTFGISGGWNREHCWCNSYGLDYVEPAYSDLHNLRPEDSNVNSSRNNKLYDVSDTNSPGYKFQAHVEAPRWRPRIRIHGNRRPTCAATWPAPCSTWPRATRATTRTSRPCSPPTGQAKSPAARTSWAGSRRSCNGTAPIRPTTASGSAMTGCSRATSTTATRSLTIPNGWNPPSPRNCTFRTTQFPTRTSSCPGPPCSPMPCRKPPPTSPPTGPR